MNSSKLLLRRLGKRKSRQTLVSASAWKIMVIYVSLVKFATGIYSSFFNRTPQNVCKWRLPLLRRRGYPIRHKVRIAYRRASVWGPKMWLAWRFLFFNHTESLCTLACTRRKLSNKGLWPMYIRFWNVPKYVVYSGVHSVCVWLWIHLTIFVQCWLSGFKIVSSCLRDSLSY